MSSYTVRLIDEAIDDLKKLDSVVVRRIVAIISWIAENADLITPIALKGDLAGMYKAREGAYRIMYQLIKAEKILLVHHIGHRSEIYRKR